MHGFSVLEQHHPQATVSRLPDPFPATDSSVGLYLLMVRILHRPSNPLKPDIFPIRPPAHVLEIAGTLHQPFIAPFQIPNKTLSFRLLQF
jgi:hypothetical protein